jgi:hypothetical protein
MPTPPADDAHPDTGGLTRMADPIERANPATPPAPDEVVAAPEAAEALAALLGDLDTLSRYLAERARHTYDLAERFVESAQRNATSRTYDERQATMLEYQHYIWVEIGGLVESLRTRYTAPGAQEPAAEPAG